MYTYVHLVPNHSTCVRFAAGRGEAVPRTGARGGVRAQSVSGRRRRTKGTRRRRARTRTRRITDPRRGQNWAWHAIQAPRGGRQTSFLARLVEGPGPRSNRVVGSETRAAASHRTRITTTAKKTTIGSASRGGRSILGPWLMWRRHRVRGRPERREVVLSACACCV